MYIYWNYNKCVYDFVKAGKQLSHENKSKDNIWAIVNIYKIERAQIATRQMKKYNSMIMHYLNSVDNKVNTQLIENKYTIWVKITSLNIDKTKRVNCDIILNIDDKFYKFLKYMKVDSDELFKLKKKLIYERLMKINLIRKENNQLSI